MLSDGMARHSTLRLLAATTALGLTLLSACSSTSSSTDPITSAATAAPTTAAPAPSTVAPGPPPTIAPSIAPPPPACITPGADSEPVEMVITDNGVLFNGAPAPSCMRVPESFRFRFTNSAEGDATVAFGDGNGTVFAGDSELTDPLGEIFFVGDEFQIAVAELAFVIDVTVIAIP